MKNLKKIISVFAAKNKYTAKGRIAKYFIISFILSLTISKRLKEAVSKILNKSSKEVELN